MTNSTQDQPTAPNQRSFSLKSGEAEAALREPCEPHVWAGGLPREPRWPQPPEEAWGGSAQLVRGTSEHGHADDNEAGGTAFGEWLGHMEARRIG
jgi:hypothetical protein